MTAARFVSHCNVCRKVASQVEDPLLRVTMSLVAAAPSEEPCMREVCLVVLTMQLPGGPRRGELTLQGEKVFGQSVPVPDWLKLSCDLRQVRQYQQWSSWPCCWGLCRRARVLPEANQSPSQILQVATFGVATGIAIQGMGAVPKLVLTNRWLCSAEVWTHPRQCSALQWPTFASEP